MVEKEEGVKASFDGRVDYQITLNSLLRQLCLYEIEERFMEAYNTFNTLINMTIAWIPRKDIEELTAKINKILTIYNQLNSAQYHNKGFLSFALKNQINSTHRTFTYAARDLLLPSADTYEDEFDEERFFRESEV